MSGSPFCKDSVLCRAPQWSKKSLMQQLQRGYRLVFEYKNQGGTISVTGNLTKYTLHVAPLGILFALCTF